MATEHNETRERILNATWSLMESGTGKGVRMSDIAKAAKVSRQAVYLHFSSRTELCVATTRYVDEVKGVDARMEKVLQSSTGREHLSRWIRFWGSYLPEIHGIAKALMADRHVDEAADAAWRDRMAAVRRGCKDVIDHLVTDGDLAPEWTPRTATDFLAALLSVSQWEQLTQDSGWSNRQYLSRMESQAVKLFVRQG